MLYQNGVAATLVSALSANQALAPAVLTGTTNIVLASADYAAAYVPLLTIAPATGAPLRNVKVVFDLAKATTGYAAVAAAQTIQFRVERKVDGTNWRGDTPVLPAALSGTLSALRSSEINLGDISVAQQARISVILTTEVGITGDPAIPYNIIYEGSAAPTVTAT